MAPPYNSQITGKPICRVFVSGINRPLTDFETATSQSESVRLEAFVADGVIRYRIRNIFTAGVPSGPFNQMLIKNCMDGYPYLRMKITTKAK